MIWWNKEIQSQKLEGTMYIWSPGFSKLEGTRPTGLCTGWLRIDAQKWSRSAARPRPRPEVDDAGSRCPRWLAFLVHEWVFVVSWAPISLVNVVETFQLADVPRPVEQPPYEMRQCALLQTVYQIAWVRCCVWYREEGHRRRRRMEPCAVQFSSRCWATKKAVKSIVTSRVLGLVESCRGQWNARRSAWCSSSRPSIHLHVVPPVGRQYTLVGRQSIYM